MTVMVASATGAALLASGACGFGPPPPDQAGQPPKLSPLPSSAEPDDETTTIATAVLAKNLTSPWGMAFLPDATVLVTERTTGRILRVGPDPAAAVPNASESGPGQTTPAPGAAASGSGPAGARPGPSAGQLPVVPVQTIDDALTSSTGGLLGIAVSPNYATDHLVYIYYSTVRDNRIAKLTLGGRPEPIVTDLPKSDTVNGGQLRFGPDGMLYASTGDTVEHVGAPNPNDLGGKILRMTPDGKPAPGNPTGTLMYSMGHDDVEGLAWSEQGTMYAIESGDGTLDEVNLIEPGKDYGTPANEGPAADPKYSSPLTTWPTDEGGCAGAAFVGKVLATACVGGQRLRLLPFTSTGTILGAPTSVLTKTFGRLRAAVAAPDGSLWVATSNRESKGSPKPEDDRILKIILGSGGAAGKV